MPSILAYFESSEAALKAKNTLQGMGIETIQIDRISEVPTRNTGEYNNPLANQATSLTELTNMGGTGLEENTDVGILLGASSASSGLSGDRIGSRNILMTVVTSQDKIGKAVKIIKEHKGTV